MKVTQRDHRLKQAFWDVWDSYFKLIWNQADSLGREEQHTVDGQLNDCTEGVLGVLKRSSMPPGGPLTENERALLIRWCGTDNAPPIILEARRLFNATIIGIRSADEKLHVGPDWV